MLSFKKYSSIENSYDREYLDRVRMQMPPDLRYVVQEKVHGANTSFISDGNVIEFAKRTSLIENGEQFYEYIELMERYAARVKALTSDIMSSFPGTVQVTVFGEMFGGAYPHKGVKRNCSISMIQKGVYYSPEHDFYAFDIYLTASDGSGRYLSVEEADRMFEKHGFFFARTLFEGTLDECLNYPNAFLSNIPQWLGYPALEDNICEGIVIRPVVPMYLRNGSRVMIKSKNERFAERKTRKQGGGPVIEPLPYSDRLNRLIAEADAFVTRQRLDNVISHIGEVTIPKDLGRIIGMFTKDALEDFLKVFGGDYSGLEKSEQKILNKKLMNRCTTVAKESLIYSK